MTLLTFDSFREAITCKELASYKYIGISFHKRWIATHGFDEDEKILSDECYFRVGGNLVLSPLFVVEKTEGERVGYKVKKSCVDWGTPITLDQIENEILSIIEENSRRFEQEYDLTKSILQTR